MSPTYKYLLPVNHISTCPWIKGFAEKRSTDYQNDNYVSKCTARTHQTFPFVAYRAIPVLPAPLQCRSEFSLTAVLQSAQSTNKTNELYILYSSCGWDRICAQIESFLSDSLFSYSFTGCLPLQQLNYKWRNWIIFHAIMWHGMSGCCYRIENSNYYCSE